MLRKRLQEAALDDDYDLKNIFKMVIAKDRENLILPINLSNRNINEIDLKVESESQPLYKGSFKFIQTRLKLNINWSIIII